MIMDRNKKKVSIESYWKMLFKDMLKSINEYYRRSKYMYI